MPARVVVVDADDDARGSLRLALSGQGYLVTESASTEDTLRMVDDDGADLVLLELDLGHNGADGFELTHQLHTTSHTGVIVVTHRADEQSKVRALELGADDYVTKPYGERELLLRVVAVLRRTRAQADAASYGGMRLNSQRNQVTLTDRVVHLSPKELLLLQALMSAHGRLLSRKDLFATVWGTSAKSDLKTLDVHIRRLRRKLEADPHEPAIIVTVRGRGYRVASGES